MEWLIVVLASFAVVALIGAPYVPSHRKALRQALTELYALGPDDVLVDLGSGDGRVVRMAASMGARAVGYEIHPLLWIVSKVWSLSDRRVRVFLRNAWRVRVPDDTTVVYIFSVQRDERRVVRLMQREVQRLGRPLTLLCYGSPLKKMAAANQIGGHFRYDFRPLHEKTLTV